MVTVFGHDVQHPAFAAFFWVGLGLIVAAWLLTTLEAMAGIVLVANGAVLAFMAMYGLSFLFFGSVVYAALFGIDRYVRWRRHRRTPAS
jgi:hypothetical protein